MGMLASGHLFLNKLVQVPHVKLILSCGKETTELFGVWGCFEKDSL